MFPILLTTVLIAAIAWFLWIAGGRRLFRLLTRDEELELCKQIASVTADLEDLGSASGAAAETLRRHYETELSRLNRALARIRIQGRLTEERSEDNAS